MNDIIANLAPCGYILAAHRYKYFALQCCFCGERYGQWTTFLRHIKTHGDKPEMESMLDFEQICGNQMPTAEEITIRDAGKESAEHLKEQEPLSAMEEKVLISRENNETNLIKIESEKEAVQFHAGVLEDSRDGVITDEEDILDESGGYQTHLRKLYINLTQASPDTLLIVDLYKAHPFLWDKTLPNYVNPEIRNQALETIIADLLKNNITTTISHLRQTVDKMLADLNDISNRLEKGQAVSVIEKCYFTQCSFLKGLMISEENISCVTDDIVDQDAISTSDDNQSESNIMLAMLSSDNEISDDEESSEPINSKKLVINLTRLNNATKDFIEQYRNHPCLWNPAEENYNKLEHRGQAISAIKKFFKDNYKGNLTEKNINSAIKRLHAFYKRFYYTKNKIGKIRKFYFERCSFLEGIEIDERIPVRNISCKKLSFGQTDDFTFNFIDLCKNHPVLWDINHENHSVGTERKKAYSEITARLRDAYDINLNNEEIYDGIHRLKQHFYNIREKETKNEPLSKVDLIYLQRCDFLPPSQRKVRCNLCKCTLRSEVTLQVHMLKKHNIGELPFKCNYCDTRFAYRASQREHEVRAHTKEFEWFCQYCKKGFANRRDMESHELVHTGARNSICEHCGKGFRLRHQMIEHVKVVHERVRRYKCTMCPKDYLRKRHLDDHIRGHLNIRDKICPTCGKAFTNFHSLFRHKQLHSEVKRYECKVCGERFHQFVGLNGHMKRKHNIVKNSNTSVKSALSEDAEVAEAMQT